VVDPATRDALLAALALQVELGADDCIGDSPVDRFAEAAAERARADRAPPRSGPAPGRDDAPPGARRGRPGPDGAAPGGRPAPDDGRPRDPAGRDGGAADPAASGGAPRDISGRAPSPLNRAAAAGGREGGAAADRRAADPAGGGLAPGDAADPARAGGATGGPGRAGSARGRHGAVADDVGASPAAASAREIAAACATLPELAAALAAFDGCPELKAGARACVFADGNPAARVMVIGEAPGRDEDLAGRPFVGRSGQLLDRMLAAIGLDRAATEPGRAAYIANVLPWRPVDNRAPSGDEATILAPFVIRHVELAAPDFLLLAGGAPARLFLGADTGILKARGRWRRVLGRPALPTLHPAYLLRTPAAKRLAWRDLLALRCALDGEPVAFD
jgi:DNA polymerase